MPFLIADDSKGKTLMLRLLVEKYGSYDVILTATTTEAAKRIIDTETIDAAFIDYRMPTENGPAVIAYLRQKQPAAHVALVSSGDSEEQRRNAKEAGAETYICTSVQEDTLIDRVRETLEEWRN